MLLIHPGRQILGDVRATRATVRHTEPLLLQSAAFLASTGIAALLRFGTKFPANWIQKLTPNLIKSAEYMELRLKSDMIHLGLT